MGKLAVPEYSRNLPSPVIEGCFTGSGIVMHGTHKRDVRLRIQGKREKNYVDRFRNR